MTGSYYKWEVKCPFFKRDINRHKIACEGLVEKSNVVLAYNYEKDFKCQMQNYCCKNYKMCEVYRMIIEAKYEDED